VTIYNDVTI